MASTLSGVESFVSFHFFSTGISVAKFGKFYFCKLPSICEHSWKLQLKLMIFWLIFLELIIIIFFFFLSVIACQIFYFWYSRPPPPVSSPYSVPVTKDGTSSKNSMLRPSYPGGVPYPPRPGEQTPLRYIFPGAPGAPPPPQSPYSGRDAVYGRGPQVIFVFCWQHKC